MIKKNNRGFTLVEIFLVAALVGVLLLTIFSTYSAGIRIWKATEELKLTEDREFYIAVEKIKRGLMGYLRGIKDIKFNGKENELLFPSVSGTDIVEVNYYFDKGDNRFLKKVSKYSDSLKDDIKPAASRFFDAEDIRFNYLFYDTQEEVGNWVTSFTEEESGIPEAIRFDIKRNGEEFSEYVFMPQ